MSRRLRRAALLGLWGLVGACANEPGGTSATETEPMPPTADATAEVAPDDDDPQQCWSALPEVADLEALIAHDGAQVRLCGRYEAIPMPSKRPPTEPVASEYAQVVLRDRTAVLLGVYNTPEAQRPRSEQRAYDGRDVCVVGEVHHVMPSTGQAPSMPGIRSIDAILEQASQAH